MPRLFWYPPVCPINSDEDDQDAIAFILIVYSSEKGAIGCLEWPLFCCKCFLQLLTELVFAETSVASHI